MNPRILIADDNPVDCLAMALTLNQAGNAQTEIAGSGACIRDRLCQRQFDLIVLDYHLDDGVAEPVLRLAETRQRRARILMVSGDEQLSGFAHELSARVVGFIHKVPGFTQTLARHMACGPGIARARSRPRRHSSALTERAGRAPLTPAIGVLGARAALVGLPHSHHFQEG